MSDIPSLPSEAMALPLGHMDALPPGTMLGEFELQALLGVGGFGMVYRGYDHSLDRPVAIKEYMPSALVGRGTDLLVSARSTADAKPFQAGLQSFIAEARLLARFDHPSLVKVYRFWEANNTAYMAMPLYEGITLKEARRRMSGPPSEEWLRQVLWSVLEALRVLHDNDTLHRDVSPDNIFLQNLGPPVLLDLGAARRALMDSSQKHTAILKVNYAPIEQYADAHDLREGPWTDLYALAAVVHGCMGACVTSRRCPPPFGWCVIACPHLPRWPKRRKPILSSRTRKRLSTPWRTPWRLNLPGVRKAWMRLPRRWRCRRRPIWHGLTGALGLGPSITLEERGVASVPLTTALLTTQPVLSKKLRSSGKTVREPSRHLRKSEVVPAPASRKTAPTGWWIAAAVALVVGVLAAALTVGIGHTPTPQAAILEQETSVAPVARAPVTEVPVPATSVGVAASASAPRNVPIVVVKPTAAPTEAAMPGDKPVGVVKSRVESKPQTPSAPPVAQGAAPVELCADASMWTKTMCVYKECQKPEYAHLPVCIADRKRWENQGNKGITP